MTRCEQIIQNIESEFPGITLDGKYDFSLCNGDTCRHSECDCWDGLEVDVREQLEKQKAAMGLTVYELRQMLENAKATEEEIVVCGLILDHLKAKAHTDKSAKWFCDEIGEFLAWRRAKIAELPGGYIEFERMIKSKQPNEEAK